VKPEAVELLATGADHGPRDDVAGEVTFARSLPVSVAQSDDVLLATHMDGVPLTAAHGAPVRLVVPGWYGMASVKWLVSLELITAPYTGYFQVRRYVYEREGRVEPVREVLVKSMITSPSEGESVRLAADGLLTVRGWAWSGAGPVARVEVGLNGVWHEAQVGRAESRWAWVPFEARMACAPGEVVISSRATDATGAVQPERIVWNRLGYGNNARSAMSFTAVM
jgi:DMSO/TMAO reductase YedYZ molybdopterin-dependent catalytic subunit